MATRKTTTRKKAAPKVNAARVCVLACENGENLILRSNPTPEEIRGFAREHLSRDPSQPDTYRVMSARFYESEYDIDDPKLAGAEVDLSDL